MGAPRSFSALALAFLSPVVVALGYGAMQLATLIFVRPFGVRPGLVLAELALAAPGLLVALALGAGPDVLGTRRPARRNVLLAVAAGATLWVASLGIFEVQYALWAPPEGYLEAFRRLHAALRPSGPLDGLVSVAAIAVAPAVCEELLFRGVVLPSVLRVLGSAAAVVVSALLFGVIHLDFTGGPFPTAYRVPFACLIGAALALLRLRSGSLTPAILAHATLNTITFLVAPLLDDPSQPLPDPRPALGAGLLAGGGAATALVMRFTRKGRSGCAPRP